MNTSLKTLSAVVIAFLLSPFQMLEGTGGLEDCNASGTETGSCGAVCNNATYVQAASCLNNASRDRKLYKDNQSSLPCGSNSTGGQSCSGIKNAKEEANGCVSQACYQN